MSKRHLAPIVMLLLAAACGTAAGFAASDVRAAGAAAGARVVTVRTGTFAGYDRFVVEFAGPVPGYEVTRQGPGFVLSPKGDPVTLAGAAGVLVRITPTIAWTSYTGLTELRPGYPILREARMLENFEAVQLWGLGVSAPACLHVSTLDSPARLVVDVSAPR